MSNHRHNAITDEEVAAWREKMLAGAHFSKLAKQTTIPPETFRWILINRPGGEEFQRAYAQEKRARKERRMGVAVKPTEARKRVNYELVSGKVYRSGVDAVGDDSSDGGGDIDAGPGS